MPAPPNTTPATAIDITALPYTQTVNVTDSTESLTNVPSCVSRAFNPVWYKYTAPSSGVDMVYIGADVAVTSNPGYIPAASVWTGSVSSLTQYSITTPGGTLTYCNNLDGGFAFRLPVTAGQTYFIQIAHDDATTGPDPSILDFTLEAAIQNDALTGYFVISDDTDGFPAAVLNTATGAYVRWQNFPAGESTDTQPTGEICTQGSEAATSVKFLDTDWNTVSTYSTGTELVTAIKSDRNGNFYVITYAGGPQKVRKFNATGTIAYTKTLPADFNNAGVWAVARDGVRLYGGATSNGADLHVYNLNTDTQEADLAVGVIGEYFAGLGDGYVDSSGRLVFMKTDNATNAFVVRYNATTGAVLNTYTLTTITYPQHFCMCDDTPGSFLVWGYVRPTTNTNAYFERVRLSDGSSLSNVGPIKVTSTSNITTAANVFDEISNSCPVFVLTADLVSPSPSPTVVYHTEPLVEKRVRQAPHIVSELQRTFVSKFQVHLQPGIGQGNDQGADPLVMFQFSKDGGRTWSNERLLPAGRVGEFTRRCISWRLGQARDWVFRISVTDPNVPWALIAAYLDIEKGTN